MNEKWSHLSWNDSDLQIGYSQRKVSVAKMDLYFECTAFSSSDSRQPFGTVSMNENCAGFLKGRVTGHISTPSRLSPSGSITLIPQQHLLFLLSAKEAGDVCGWVEWKLVSRLLKAAVSLRSRGWWILTVSSSQHKHTQAQNRSVLLKKSEHLHLTFLFLLLEAVSMYFLTDPESTASLLAFHYYCVDLSLRAFPLQKHRDVFENRVQDGLSMDL